MCREAFESRYSVLRQASRQLSLGFDFVSPFVGWPRVRHAPDGAIRIADDGILANDFDDCKPFVEIYLTKPNSFLKWRHDPATSNRALRLTG